MKISVSSGKYVLAVSGGVDSMVLLDLLSPVPKPERSSLQSDYGASSFGLGLSKLRGVELVVAHFNHGIRADSDEDEKLVAGAASRYGWPLEVGRGQLGADASEATARRARYEFLERVSRKYKAKKIITGHHQDDLIETALLNILRGTNRRGLSAMADNPKVLRPLLNVPKTEIISYARDRGLAWREDSTNQSSDYLRNYLRLKVLPKLSEQDRETLLANLTKIKGLNSEIDKQIVNIGTKVRHGKEIDRQIFAGLPDKIADELMVHWLREGKSGEIDRYEVSRLKLALKTAKPNTEHQVKGSRRLAIKAQTATFK